MATPEYDFDAVPPHSETLSPIQRQKREWRFDYLRRLAYEPSPFPAAAELDLAYHWLTENLGETPHKTQEGKILHGTPIPEHMVESRDLLLFENIGAVIAPPTGNETCPQSLHQAGVLGLNTFEPPPQFSGLDPNLVSTYVRFNKYISNDAVFEQLIATLQAGGMTKYEAASDYLLHDIPPSTLWLAVGAIDALKRLEEKTGLTLTDEKTGKLIPELAERTMVLNGDNGGGEVYLNHLEHLGIVRPSTVIEYLAHTQTGFVANVLGTKRSRTENGACAASGIALATADTIAHSTRGSADLFFIISAYPGPVYESRKIFKELGIEQSIELPFMAAKPPGYAESQIGVVSIVMTRQLAEELGLSLSEARLIRTLEDHGTSKLGSAGDDVPGITLSKVPDLLNYYYPQGYTGAVAVAAHGVNSMGSMNEVEALMNLKGVLDSNHQIEMDLVSTQTLWGHQYSPRVILSMLMLNASSDVLWGMARAETDLTLFEEHEKIQKHRRFALETITGKEIEPQPINHREHEQRRALKLYNRLKNAGINLALTPMKLPENTLHMCGHTGLGGHSVAVAAFPISC